MRLDVPGGSEGALIGLRSLVEQAHVYMRASHYLWGEATQDIGRAPEFKDALKTLGPVINVLPQENDLASTPLWQNLPRVYTPLACARAIQRLEPPR